MEGNGGGRRARHAPDRVRRQQQPDEHEKNLGQESAGNFSRARDGRR